MAETSDAAKRRRTEGNEPTASTRKEDVPHAGAPSDKPEANLPHLRLHKIFKESDGPTLQFQPNPGPHASNLVASLTESKVILYDNSHCGRHLDMIFQYTHAASPYVKGDKLVSCSWASGSDPRDVYLLIGTNQGDILVLELAATRISRILSGHTNAIVALAANGCTAVSASKDEMLRVWDLTTFTCAATVPYSASVVAFIPTSNTFLTGNSSGNVCKWTISPEARLEKVDVSKLAGGSINSIAVVNCTDGQRVAATTKKTVHTISASGTTNSFTLEQSRRKARNVGVYDDEDGEDFCGAAALSPCGSFVVIGDTIGRLHVHRFSTGERVHILSFKRIRGPSVNAMLCRDFSNVVFATGDGLVWRYDLPYLESDAKKTIEIVSNKE